MRFLIVFLFLIYTPVLLAQQVVATAGGTLGNSNGTISYTIGEGVTQTLTKGDKTLTQGFHQTTVLVIPINKKKDLDFSISVYPNPTSDKVTVKVEKEDITGLQFLLFNMNGKLILQKNLESNETSVSVEQLSSGFYLLKIQEGAIELRTFKIVKQ
jgi:hypothetical protein